MYSTSCLKIFTCSGFSFSRLKKRCTRPIILTTRFNLVRGAKVSVLLGAPRSKSSAGHYTTQSITFRFVRPLESKSVCVVRPNAEQKFRGEMFSVERAFPRC